MPAPLPPLAARFVDTFRRAIDREMVALREQRGPFEIPLLRSEHLASDEAEREHHYRFELARAESKLAAGAECSLRAQRRESLVTVERIEGTQIYLRASQRLPQDESTVLVVYPWYLYERLKEALARVNTEEFCVELGLALFGKADVGRTECRLVTALSALNESQRHAVRLCSESTIAFVWGPPGTGKTQTLAHVVGELVAQGQRLLLTSTTHAALDQALGKMAEHSAMRERIERGEVVRLGQGEGELHGAGLSQVVRRREARVERRLVRGRQRVAAVSKALERVREATTRLRSREAPEQQSLFLRAAPQALGASELSASGLPPRLAWLSTAEQSLWLGRRGERLQRLCELLKESLKADLRRLRQREKSVVGGARVVLATLTSVYLSPLLEGQRFDAVVVEEAGMANLPALFFAACLARRKALMVGDPRQLPPIVLSRERFVAQAMGRSIFEVSAPTPSDSPWVALLDLQYRMHPAIGNLVSELYYEGRVRNAPETAERRAIAALPPFAGEAVVLIDTRGTTTCAASSATGSRSNEATARLSVEHALAAADSGAESVAIITPYADQSRLIRRLLGRRGEVIACSTVHRFQGHERDIVILDTVDALPLRPGVLTTREGASSQAENLLNVSISRARGKLILIADVAYFRDQAPRSPLRKLLEAAARQSGGVSPELS